MLVDGPLRPRLASFSVDMFYQPRLYFHSTSSPIFPSIPIGTSSSNGTISNFEIVRALLTVFSGKPFFHSLKTSDVSLLSNMLAVAAWILPLQQLEQHVRALQRETATRITRQTIARFADLRRRTADTRHEISRAKQEVPIALERLFQTYKQDITGTSETSKDKVCFSSRTK